MPNDCDRLTSFDIRFLMRVNEMGIIPFCDSAKEFRKALKSLPPGERRIVKRKFRKAWRKMQKKYKREGQLYAASLFFPDWEHSKKTLSGTTRWWRQSQVFDNIKRSVRNKNGTR